ALVDLVAHPEEDVLDLALDLRQQVEPPARERLAGQRHVHRALRVDAVELGALEPGPLLLDGRLELLPQRVQPHPRVAVPDFPERQLEPALPAEVGDTGVVELVERPGAYDCGACLLEIARLPTHRSNLAAVSRAPTTRSRPSMTRG